MTYYRSAKQTLSSRNWKKLTQNTTWFRKSEKKGDEDGGDKPETMSQCGFERRGEKRLQGGKIKKRERE